MRSPNRGTSTASRRKPLNIAASRMTNQTAPARANILGLHLIDTSLQLVACPSPLLERRDVRQRRLTDRAQRFARKERLVRRDEHVRKRQQSGEYVVLDDLRREIAEEQLFLFLIDVEAEVPDLAGLQAINERSRVDEDRKSVV